MAYDSTQDPYAQRSVPLNSHARGALAVTKSDTVDLSPYAKRLFIGGAGNVACIPVANYAAGNLTPVVYTGLAAGTYLDVQIARVMSTSTTATNMVAESN